MLSPSKLITLGIVLVLVWFIFRTIERRNNVTADAASKAKKSTTVEMTECAVCGAWVDSPCAEKDCPISG
ncbi:MAG: hypothetical protein J4F41_04965 [Alphaproteobacteria bacterium]|nr:hypothetical protein [Alphaproteobacteria bacterium]